MPAAAYTNPFGPQRVDTWLQNLAWLRSGFERQHLPSTGEHNAFEVPRVCRRINLAGIVYSLADASSDITAITRVAAGHVRFTLAASRFTTDMRVQINIAGSGSESKPWLHRVEVTSATQIEVYLHQLSSALGAGNTWAAADIAFDIAIHSSPLAQTAWAASPYGGQAFPLGFARGQTLGAPVTAFSEASDYNDVLWQAANVSKQFLAEHSTDGTTNNGLHNTRQVARHFVQGRFRTAGTYDIIDQLGPIAITLAEPSAGQVTVTFASALTGTGISPFICPDWTRQDATVGSSGALAVIHAKVDSTTQTTLWMYRYDRVANTWSRARSDFWGVWHSG
jgi:hypothetical protein